MLLHTVSSLKDNSRRKNSILKCGQCKEIFKSKHDLEEHNTSTHVIRARHGVENVMKYFQLSQIWRIMCDTTILRTQLSNVGNVRKTLSIGSSWRIISTLIIDPKQKMNVMIATNELQHYQLG